MQAKGSPLLNIELHGQSQVDSRAVLFQSRITLSTCAATTNVNGFEPLPCRRRSQLLGGLLAHKHTLTL